jgi:hypothetical protein
VLDLTGEDQAAMTAQKRQYRCAAAAAAAATGALDGFICNNTQLLLVTPLIRRRLFDMLPPDKVFEGVGALRSCRPVVVCSGGCGVDLLLPCMSVVMVMVVVVVVVVVVVNLGTLVGALLLLLLLLLQVGQEEESLRQHCWRFRCLKGRPQSEKDQNR